MMIQQTAGSNRAAILTCSTTMKAYGDTQLYKKHCGSAKSVVSSKWMLCPPRCGGSSGP